jgi:aminobenzoyl-glutamate transport protein
MLGIGVAESSGLIKAAVNAMLAKADAKYITVILVFLGVISSLATDIGYVLIIPMAGVIFHAMGRNPIVGMAVTFAAVSAGFSANIIITPLDPVLSGISTEAAKIIDPSYYVQPTANYFYLCAVTIVLTLVGTLVTSKWVEPRFGKYTGDVPQEAIVPPTDLERKGLRRAGWVLLVWLAILLIGLIPENGYLRGIDGGLLQSPVLKGILTLILFVGVSTGAVFGFTTGKFKKAEDIIFSMHDIYKTLVVFLVLCFFCSQFVAWFRWSNLGMLLAIGGSDVLTNAKVSLVPMVIIFAVFTAVINIFIGSAAAKWAILSPIYIPIFMLMGHSPEVAQAVYHAGDNATNIISPLMPMFGLIIVYYQKYDKSAGIGTVIASTLPYSITFLFAWITVLIAFILIGIPLGPGVSFDYVMPGVETTLSAAEYLAPAAGM